VRSRVKPTRLSLSTATLLGLGALLAVTWWIGPLPVILLVAAGVGVLVWLRRRPTTRRRRQLTEKYGNPELVERIMRRAYWQGQTAGQLRDSLGAPRTREEELLETKTREVWRYAPLDEERCYAVRITLENGLVVHWDTRASSAPVTRSGSVRPAPKPNGSVRPPFEQRPGALASGRGPVRCESQRSPQSIGPRASG
jgi:hypothetical protein